VDRTRPQEAREGLPHNEVSPAAANPRANQNRSPKKSRTSGTTIAAVCRTLKETATRQSLRHVCDEVTRTFGHLAPAQLTAFLANSLVAKWRANHPGRGTAHVYRNDLRQVCDALASFGAPPFSIAKAPRSRQRAVTASGEELARLLKDPPPFLRLFMLLYFQSGLRFTETLRVNTRSWNPQRHTLTVQVKGGHTRTVLVSPDVENLFLAAGNPDPETPFLHALYGRPFSPTTLRHAWTTHKRRANVNPNLNAHDLRRTAASILYTATKDLRVAQELLGHKNLNSTLAYLAPLHPDDARKYAELLRFEHFRSPVKQ
jgi:integrase